MEVSNYAQALLNGSNCCHKVTLSKGGKRFVGIYNGLASWERVEDGRGNLVENLETEWEDDEETGPKSYQPSFTEKVFADVGGYQVVK